MGRKKQAPLQEEGQELQTCAECGERKRIEVFGRRADGTRRIKCNGCLRGYNTSHPRQMQLPPMDIHPLPKIVKEALKNPQEEIETFSIVQQKSKDDDKMTADFLLGKKKPRRGGKTKHY